MGRRKFKGITSKILIPICFIILITIVTSIFTLISVFQMRSRLNKLNNETIKEMEDIEQIRYQILHTGEILTDVSATHDEEGFEEAKEFHDEIHALAEEIIENDPSKKEEWEAILKSYDNYYEYGIKMANAYIYDGIDAGNEVMETVDVLTDELSETVDNTTLAIEEELEAEVDEIIKNALLVGNFVLILGVLYIIFLIYILILVLKQIVSPVKKVSSSLMRLADHDLTVSQIRSNKKDEIGGLIFAFNELQGSLRSIMTDLDETSTNLENLSSNMSLHSGTISQNVSEITNAVNNVAEMAVQQVNDIERSQSEINDLLEISEQNASMANNLSEASKRISEAGQEGNKVLDELYDITKISEKSYEEIFKCIDKIKQSAERINAATGMIDNIAEQTNLLSLNASIEAARAGDAGKGFSVVANEIRSLSEGSAESVQEINNMIIDLQANVNNAIEQSEVVRDAVAKQATGMEGTRNSYKKIADTLDEINDEIASLNTISKHMQKSCNSVNTIMLNLSDVAGQNAAYTEETTASIEEVLSMTDQINNGTIEVKSKTDLLNNVVKTYTL